MIEQQIKENAEQMAIQVIQYLHEACKTNEEYKQRCLELSSSFVTATVDWDKDVDEICKSIINDSQDVRMMALGGAIRYKTGDDTNVKKIYYDKED